MTFGVKGPSSKKPMGASYPSCHFQVHRVREYSTDLCLWFSVACTNAKLKGPATDLQRALEAVRNGMLVRHNGVSEKNYSRDGRVPGIIDLDRPDLDVVHENELVQHIVVQQQEICTRMKETYRGTEILGRQWAYLWVAT